ncbi:MAG: type II toxin-antitoxin system PemK/MazF family toxin [Chitinophagales bacterium]|nr:type II toxin-antitoxin system PemK/MazF family toxin [Chitinophagales bacterium]
MHSLLKRIQTIRHGRRGCSTGIKRRPAVVVKKIQLFNDYWVCVISTQLNREVKGLDILIQEGSNDFKIANLRSSSVIRVAFLAMVPAKDIKGTIGFLSKPTLQQIKQNIARFILEN